MPVGAGLSASAANETAGAQTKLAGAYAGLVLLLMTVFGKEWISTLPQALVAVAVINALSHTLNPHALLNLWRLNRDQYIALTAIIAVLLFGVLHGMLIAICLSLVSAIRAFSMPLISELGEFDNTRDYVDAQNHATAIIHQHILILRPEAPLFFANVESVLNQALKRLDTRKDTQILILSLEESANLDSTATQSLIEFSHQLSSQKILLLLARVKDPIDELLSNLDKSPFKDTLFWSVDDAVIAAQKSILIDTQICNDRMLN
jgi:MFS superfamily sulfate permease-like transporter